MWRKFCPLLPRTSLLSFQLFLRLFSPACTSNSWNTFWPGWEVRGVLRKEGCQIDHFPVQTGWLSITLYGGEECSYLSYVFSIHSQKSRYQTGYFLATGVVPVSSVPLTWQRELLSVALKSWKALNTFHFFTGIPRCSKVSCIKLWIERNLQLRLYYLTFIKFCENYIFENCLNSAHQVWVYKCNVSLRISLQCHLIDLETFFLTYIFHEKLLLMSAPVTRQVML